MACPDELTLDLWLAGALPSNEAATVAAHVPTCDACMAAQQAFQSFGSELHAALVLDPDERAYLAGLKLTTAGHAAQSAAPMHWSWLALFGVIAGFAAWLLAAPLIGQALATASQVGLNSVLLRAALGVLVGLGQALIDLT